jgi:hypothetical protein
MDYLSLKPLAMYVSTPSFMIASCTPNKSLSLSILLIIAAAAYLVAVGTSAMFWPFYIS